MTIAIIAFISFIIGGVLVVALMSKATRRWREMDSLRLKNESLHAEQTKLAAEVQKATVRLDSEKKAFAGRAEAFERQKISFDELAEENRILKQDLRNIDVAVSKTRMDHGLQEEKLATISERSAELAQRYLADVEKWVAASINASNYAACKQRLTKAIEWCREIGFEVTAERESELLANLKADFEEAVRVALQREEQARIKAQIKEEQQREKEIQRELDAIERERSIVKAALERALADANLAHSEEVTKLQARLADAEARSLRVVSQAQLTKAGHIYVISNIGAYGERVFKIGMTRRLEPKDRIAELGDASVPFPFDVHMMISSDNAPSLENALHKRFSKQRVNKVNMRKEFFRVDLDDIRKVVESQCGEVKFVSEPEASEYRQSLTISDEDEAYIEDVFDQAESAVGVQDAED